MNFKAFTRIILILLGMLMFFLFIWFKFIRERLPKEIPFTLSTYGFLILLYICIVYLIITVIYIRYDKIMDNKIRELSMNPREISYTCIQYLFNIIVYYFRESLLILVSNFFKPLKAFDEAIKSTKIFNLYFDKILLTIISIVQNKREILFKKRIAHINTFLSDFFTIVIVPKDRLYFAADEGAYRLYYIFIQILPRSILCITFLIDTFYFSCLFYIYKVVYIYILVILCKYIAHSARYAKEQYILEIEKHIDNVRLPSKFALDDFYKDEESANDADDEDQDFGPIDPGITRSIRRFLNIQAHVLVYGGYKGEKTHYQYVLWLNKENEHVETPIQIKCIYLIENALSLSIFLDEYEFISQDYSRIRYIKIIIFFLYFFTWTYILVCNIFWTLILSHLLI